MTKDEYLEELEKNLTRLPEAERAASLGRCAEQFAGEKSSEETIARLGNPTRLAAQIMAEYSSQALNIPIFSKLDASDADLGADGVGHIPEYSPYAGDYSPEGSAYSASKPQSTGKKYFFAVWSVILGIMALPVALPLALAALVLILALACIGVALIIALFFAVVALFAVSIFTIIYGSPFFATIEGSALATLGTAFLLFGVGLVFVPLFVTFCVWSARTTGRAISWLFVKLKGTVSR